MASLNKVCLLGNVGGDPEIRTTNDGKKIANFSMATSDKWKDRSGDQREKTEWHRVVVFNENLSKIVQEFVRKGDKLYLEGKLQTRKWKDQSGTDRYTTEVVLQNFDGKIVMCGSAADRPQPGEDREEASEHRPGRPTTRQPVRGTAPDLDDDIPF